MKTVREEIHMVSVDVIDLPRRVFFVTRRLASVATDM